jgi:Raf kinase inhibitor-like YbhB/YbcL family protein
MKKTLSVLAFSSLLSSPALALSIDIGGIGNGDKIPVNFAYCAPDGNGKTKPGGNLNPQIRWSGAPEGTKSFAVLVVDPDVPATFDDANKEGKTIAEDFPRQNFYHWVLVDIPSTISSLKQGQDSSGVRGGGKPTGKTPYGINGQNDYASFMKGTFGGYDGPCPPWNDARLHHYHFRVYALDVESLGLKEPITGKDAEEAIGKHTLAMGESVGTFSNYAK